MLRSYIEVDESTHAALNPQITDNSRSENRIKRLSKFAGFMFALSVATAAFGQTGLNRVGPVANGPGGNGYPAWYQDKTGLTLNFCSPTTDAVLAGGWCVLLAGDLPSVPEVFPTNFFDEHFYFLANATGTTLNGGKAKLVLALEGAFGGGVPLAGDQIVFARVRFVVDNLPQNGTYTIYHPYGTDVFPNQVQGDRLFFTEDIGIGCPSGFECANTGRIGPYLLPADTPGGPELAATRGPDGRLYLTDPNRLGPITKSPVGQNYFRVVAPDGTDILNVPVDASGQRKITDFTLNGRVVEGSLPGRVNVDRATFSSDNGRVDVFASIFPTLQARVPGAAVPGAPTPLLQYYSGACTASPTGVLSAPTGQSAAGMRALGNSAWGQSTGATQGNPSQVCLEDRTSSAFFQGNVTDLIRVTQAEYDPANGSLTVTATSSDTAAVLTLGEFNAPLNMNSGTGSVTVTAGAAPPQIIHVSSKIGGTGQAQVASKISNSSIPINDVLTAQNINANVASGASVTITVPNAGSNLVHIVAQGTKGTADLNAATNTLRYTANADASGVDSFTYNLSSSCTQPCTPLTSNTATVTVTITGTTPPPPPPGTVESTTVTQAQFRTDQARWNVTGTDTVAQGQILTIKNIGPIAPGTPKNVTIGTAVVGAGGAWALDVRGVTGAVIPAAGDQIIVTNGNTVITAQPTTITIRR